MADSGSTSFNLTAEEGGFKSRCDDVFAGLASLERKHEAFATVQSRNRTWKERESLTKPDPKEDPVQPNHRPSFRRPQSRGARRPRYQPGFRANPGKWTAYDLSDVSSDQLSDRSNTAAAFQFLEERRRAKGSPEEHTPADLSQKMEFSYPAKSKEGTLKTDSAEKKFQSGKLVMPEYDVGQKSSKPKRRKVDVTGAAGSSGSVNLNYLQEDDQDSTITEQAKKKELDPEKDKDLSMDVEENTRSMQDCEEKEPEMNKPKRDGINSDLISSTKSETKFRKVSAKRGIRRRQRDEDDDD